eukprot:TRINITY_DN1456_c0_g4_i2.p1 TRINITY_DN1456_c0_g4~~TRINITY_DN1456_c0_g4_i2.p1  ORF type:complete len:326 (+),score=74.38 TRINITY_DN1456_c0_g4_i2:1061-2038(+)
MLRTFSRVPLCRAGGLSAQVWAGRSRLTRRCCGTTTRPSAGLPGPEASAWDVLGIKRTATLQEARQAYQQLLTKVHPDTPGGSDEEFRRVQAAWKEVQDGPPAHMVFGRDQAEQAAQVLFWAKLEAVLARFGLRINWKNVHDRYNKKGTKGIRYFIILYSAFWFCYVCEPWRPWWLVYLFVAWVLDMMTGGYFLALLIPYLWWYSLYGDYVAGAFVGPYYYWDVGRPNALTMAMGIPNYWWSSDTEVVMDRSKQIEQNRSAYGRYMGKGRKNEETEEAVAPPPTAAQRIAAAQIQADVGSDIAAYRQAEERMRNVDTRAVPDRGL